jgi:hypothetical protein
MDISDLLDAVEADLRAEIDQLLVKIKRDCRPEFAARVEEYLRIQGMLSPSNKGN